MLQREYWHYQRRRQQRARRHIREFTDSPPWLPRGAEIESAVSCGKEAMERARGPGRGGAFPGGGASPLLPGGVLLINVR